MRTSIRLAFIGAVVLFTSSARAQHIVDTSRGVVVATPHRVELHRNGNLVWSAEGVAQPTKIVAGANRVAVLDALDNEARVIDLTTGRSTLQKTGETPVDAAFDGEELFVLTRGDRDAAFVRMARGKLLVYTRSSGTLEERNGRTATVAPFASDLETDGRTAYLLYPREAKIRTVDLATMQVGEFGVGAVPIDLAITGRSLVVADPSAKRVWVTEGVETMTEAVARGFLRGLLGLGLGGNRTSEFPTGVDRVESRGRKWVAYDSSSRTLYRSDGKKSSVVARNVAPHAFALTDAGVAVYRDGRLTIHR